jgi:hypothetical protein
VKLAQDQHVAEGGELPTPEPRPPPPRRGAAPTASARKTLPAPRTPEVEVRTRKHSDKKAKAGTVTGEVIPGPGHRKRQAPQDQPRDPDAPPSVGFVSDDGETYTVMTMFGPKERAIVRTFVESQDSPVRDAMDIIDHVGQQFTNAEALMRSALKRVGDGHTVLDPQAFAAGVDLQLKSMQLLHKVLKDARNLDSVRRFLDIVFEALRKEDKVFAQRVTTLLREAARNFVPTVQG